MEEWWSQFAVTIQSEKTRGSNLVQFELGDAAQKLKGGLSDGLLG